MSGRTPGLHQCFTMLGIFPSRSRGSERMPCSGPNWPNWSSCFVGSNASSSSKEGCHMMPPKGSVRNLKEKHIRSNWRHNLHTNCIIRVQGLISFTWISMTSNTFQHYTSQTKSLLLIQFSARVLRPFRRWNMDILGTWNEHYMRSPL